MALPLLAMGLGLWGGAQFLNSRRDEREAESLLSTFQPQAQGLDADQVNARYESAAAQLQEESGHFLDPNKESKARSLLSAYDDEMKAREAAAQKAEADRIARTDTYSKELYTNYNRNLKDFGEVIQPAYLKAQESLAEGANSADTIASLYNFFNIVEPGGRVTENEDGSFTAIGGAGGQVANWLNKIRGEGLDETVRAQIQAALRRQYLPEYDRAQRQKTYYEDQMRNISSNEGIDVRDPTGSLGIDWTQQRPGPPQQEQEIQNPDPERYEWVN